jgi:tetratricopeptide (TPR) repeat protein
VDRRSLPCAEHAVLTTAWVRRLVRGTLAVAAGLLGLLAAAQPLAAQTLAPKRTLTTGAAPGCDLAPIVTDASSPRNTAEARRLAAAGQEATLEGDQVAARDAFARASLLNPADERLLYDLARAHEALADTLPAIGAYCRYLGLAPAGTEASDVRARLAQLVPDEARQRAEDAAVAFRLGLGFLEERQFEAAVRAFDEVVRLAPAALEGPHNRALARSAVGRRREALEDLELVRAAAPTVEDRVAIAQAIDVLRRPVYSPGAAFARGLVPGFGQLYTGRPVRGVVVMALVAGAAGAAFTPQTEEREIAYIDPNGVPAPYTEVVRERPWFVPGLAAAGALTVLAALEATNFANRSRRGASILAAATSLRPALTPRGDAGVGVSIRF